MRDSISRGRPGLARTGTEKCFVHDALLQTLAEGSHEGGMLTKELWRACALGPGFLLLRRSLLIVCRALGPSRRLVGKVRLNGGGYKLAMISRPPGLQRWADCYRRVSLPSSRSPSSWRTLKFPRSQFSFAVSNPLESKARALQPAPVFGYRHSRPPSECSPSHIEP